MAKKGKKGKGKKEEHTEEAKPETTFVKPPTLGIDIENWVTLEMNVRESRGRCVHKNRAGGIKLAIERFLRGVRSRVRRCCLA